MAVDTPEAEMAKIEVTPEMIEAGMVEYGGHWCGLRDADDDIAREMLRAAFLAMFRVSPLCLRVNHVVEPRAPKRAGPGGAPRRRRRLRGPFDARRIWAVLAALAAGAAVLIFARPQNVLDPDSRSVRGFEFVARQLNLGRNAIHHVASNPPKSSCENGEHQRGQEGKWPVILVDGFGGTRDVKPEPREAASDFDAGAYGTFFVKLPIYALVFLLMLAALKRL